MAGRCLFACFFRSPSTQVTHQTGRFGVIAYVGVLRRELRVFVRVSVSRIVCE